MSQRLNQDQRQYIWREMIELARFLTVHCVPPPKIKDAVGRLRDDLKQAYKQGITDITVDRNSYLENRTDQEKGEAP